MEFINCRDEKYNQIAINTNWVAKILIGERTEYKGPVGGSRNEPDIVVTMNGERYFCYDPRSHRTTFASCIESVR